MTWTIKFIPKIKKELRRLDKKDSKALLDFLEFEILPLDDPRTLAIPLKKNLKEFWKFRIGQFRIIADIQDDDSPEYASGKAVDVLRSPIHETPV